MSRFLSLFSTLLIVFMLSGCTTTQQQKTPPTAPHSATQKLINLGNSMIAAGDVEAGLGFFQKAASNEPTNEDVVVTYAKNLMLYDINDAVTYLSQATQDIQSPRLYNWYGVSLDLNADHIKAQKIYQDGLNIDPKNISLMNNLGLSFAVTGQTEAARALFNKVIALEPDNSLYHQNKAIATILSGDDTLVREELSNIMPAGDIDALIATYGKTTASSLELLRLINGL